jgi:hypothetical protein
MALGFRGILSKIDSVIYNPFIDILAYVYRICSFRWPRVLRVSTWSAKRTTVSPDWTTWKTMAQLIWMSMAPTLCMVMKWM